MGWEEQKDIASALRELGAALGGLLTTQRPTDRHAPRHSLADAALGIGAGLSEIARGLHAVAHAIRTLSHEDTRDKTE